MPHEADLVTYWFEKARAMVAAGQVKRVGLIATQSIRGGANRRVLERVKETGDIFLGWSDEPWIRIGVEIERVKMGNKKPKAEPFTHGLGQALLALTRRNWAVLVVYWPTTGSAEDSREERQRLRDSLEQLVRNGRLRVVILPSI